MTSADARPHRPESICLLCERPSRAPEETSACHGSDGYVEEREREVVVVVVEGGVLKQAAFSTMHLAKIDVFKKKERKKRAGRSATQLSAEALACKGGEEEVVLKCGDVWPEPSVSVATLHPLPHFATQNKHGSDWTAVIPSLS